MRFMAGEFGGGVWGIVVSGTRVGSVHVTTAVPKGGTAKGYEEWYVQQSALDANGFLSGTVKIVETTETDPCAALSGAIAHWSHSVTYAGNSCP